MPQSSNVNRSAKASTASRICPFLNCVGTLKTKDPTFRFHSLCHSFVPPGFRLKIGPDQSISLAVYRLNVVEAPDARDLLNQHAI